ncbi:excinuclease ABC subunit UvrC [Endomicrobium proavitum]|uniref:Excinuclease UvrABC, endonuclease subunit n=1 Tax=Endomicrobium proavitum TaxID=1408281 RepID=A0A0G3WK29_9BACT|nr:excinuclease ABC subunit UvrC [Endomicrobium proavitum]AKL97859.1 excinuclease UvrABC, endonuclease subunit [Endomicrobium proavitum]
MNKHLENIPKLPGVYIMRDGIGNIIYIGKAKSLKDRISSYFNADSESKSTAIITSMRKIDYILCASEREALIIERQLINKVQPYFNAMWKDDKSYPYIKFSLQEDFPRLTLTRKKLKDGAEYFGPYPQIFYIKKLVRWLVKLFKIRPCKLDFSEDKLPEEKKVKSCIYVHTDMCYGPCLGKISSADYKNKIKDIELFLNGKFKKLADEWETQMSELSSQLKYEQAQEIRDRLYALQNMSERVMISEITQNDINKSVERADSINELKQVLHLKHMPAVIEGFDNSNIQGTNAVASMVRFTNGIADKKNYRRFKIKTVTGADDFASMHEVVFRRYSGIIRKNEKLPDLILIDGGKGQLSAAAGALEELQVLTPVISLAKKNEEIFFPQKDKPLVLSKHSAALKLLQSVRDESHRFAVSYHRKLREKEFLNDK